MSRRHSFTLNAQIAEKLRRKVNIFLAGNSSYAGTPPPRKPLDGPFADSITRGSFVRDFGQGVGNGCWAAESLNQFPNQWSMGMHSQHSIGYLIRTVKTADSEDDLTVQTPQNYPMAEDTKDPYKVECGRRLRLAIDSANYTLSALARDTLADDDDPDSIKRAQNNLSKWVRGENAVPTWYVRRLKSVIGVTLDWVFDGDMAGLPDRLRDNIHDRQRRGC